MKKLVINAIVLALALGTAFFIGWYPLRVPSGSYAVLVSKTGGVHSRLLVPGRFAWSAAFLLPTNARLVMFRPSVATRTVELSGELPSGTAYSAFLPGKPDFSWKLTVRLSASVRPEVLPDLVRDFGVETDASLQSWLDAELSRAVEDLRPLLYASTTDADRALALMSGNASPALLDTLAGKRQALQLHELSVLADKSPDIALYESGRRLYATYLDTFRASVEPALAEASRDAAVQQSKLDLLERYGELLSRYPVLVDYLAIQAGIAPRALPGGR